MKLNIKKYIHNERKYYKDFRCCRCYYICRNYSSVVHLLSTLKEIFRSTVLYKCSKIMCLMQPQVIPHNVPLIIISQWYWVLFYVWYHFVDIVTKDELVVVILADMNPKPRADYTSCNPRRKIRITWLQSQYHAHLRSGSCVLCQMAYSASCVTSSIFWRYRLYIKFRVIDVNETVLSDIQNT